MAIALLAALLAACSGDNLDDLRSFTENVHKDKKPSVTPPPEIKTYPNFSYKAGKLRDPFSQGNLAPPSGSGAKGGSNEGCPDPARPKHPLEDYPLDTLKMVGTIKRGNMRWAVIKVQSGIGEMHRAKVGTYLGRNDGMITAITETKIVLIEILRNATGRCIEREAVIQIQE